MQLGERLRELRIQAGITQVDAARHAGVSTHTWHRYETGDRNPQAHRIPALANALDIPLAALFRRDIVAEIALTEDTRALLAAGDQQAATDLATALAARIIATTQVQHATVSKRRPVTRLAPIEVARRLERQRERSYLRARDERERIERAQAVE